MKNLKFRVYDEGLKEMIYFDLKSANDTVDCTIYEDVMLFTGLSDRVGKEIYEGDILQYPDSEIQEVVKWKKNMWTEEGYMTGFGEFTFTPDQYEIIGNIYENPELLNNQIKEEKLKEE